MSAPALVPTSCIHCGNPLGVGARASYCCSGCEAVHAWIEARGLGRYYDLKARVGSPALAPAEPGDSFPGTGAGDESFAYLDEPRFRTLYCRESDEGATTEFYLEGVHCAACVWLTEKVADILENVSLVRLNLATSVATVKVRPGGSFASVAREFRHLGYRPHPVKRGESEELQKKENRSLLIRMGVAAACAGNIMLLAVALYGGASGSWGANFRWVSLALFLPVITYSAMPFYRSAGSALRAREISIDIPVVFGILLGSVVSVVNLAVGDERVYFDSLASLIFLLLSTRYLLKRVQQSALGASHLLNFLTPGSAWRWSVAKGDFVLTPVDDLVAGDRVRVLPGECVPADGIVLSGAGSLNCAFLSGESRPVAAARGEIVFAGTQNLEAPLEITVTQAGALSRLGRIVTSMETLLKARAPISVFTDRMARYFVLAVTVIAAGVFLFGFASPSGDWHEAMNRALAIAIVTCPCTFALATPLAFSLTLGRLARAGVLIKSPEAIERMTEVTDVFLDKTGTLTEGSLRVLEWIPELRAGTDLAAIENAVVSLESRSAHPVARALSEHLAARAGELSPVSGFSEKMGEGVRGEVGGRHYEIRRASETDGSDTIGDESRVEVLCGGRRVGLFRLGDRLRRDSARGIQRLQQIGLQAWILSGDSRGPVRRVARELGLCRRRCISSASPERKSEILKAHPRSMMVGDGANDSVSLAGAHVGVAVRGGMEISLRAADVYLNRPGVASLAPLITVSRETLRVIHRNLALSVIYNLVAGAAALTGRIDPLFAAILMPASAVTVFLSSLAGTSRMKAALRELGAVEAPRAPLTLASPAQAAVSLSVAKQEARA